MAARLSILNSSLSCSNSIIISSSWHNDLFFPFLLNCCPLNPLFKGQQFKKTVSYIRNIIYMLILSDLKAFLKVDWGPIKNRLK